MYHKLSPTWQGRKEWSTKENKGELHDASIGAAAVGEKDEATLNSEEIKPVAIAIIELHLSEGISKYMPQSCSRQQKGIKLARAEMHIPHTTQAWCMLYLPTLTITYQNTR